MRKLSRAKWCFLGFVICLLLLVGGSILAPGRLAQAIYGISDSVSGGRFRAVTEPGTGKSPTMVEMNVAGIEMSRVSYQPLLVLKQRGAEQQLVLGIGVAEANAISIVLEGISMPRPLTHDLLRSLLDTMGASIDFVVIHDLRDNIFYAKIALNVNGRHMKIDSRPSDAVAIALRVKAPIYAEKELLEKTGGPRSPLEGERIRSLFELKERHNPTHAGALPGAVLTKKGELARA